MSPGIILNLQNKQIKVLFGILISSIAVSHAGIISTPVTALAESVPEEGIDGGHGNRNLHQCTL